MANLIVHCVSLTFAVLCVLMTGVGVVATIECGRWLECAWGVAAFGLSCWLVKQLGQKCWELLDKLGW